MQAEDRGDKRDVGLNDGETSKIFRSKEADQGQVCDKPGGGMEKRSAYSLGAVTKKWMLKMGEPAHWAKDLQGTAPFTRSSKPLASSWKKLAAFYARLLWKYDCMPEVIVWKLYRSMARACPALPMREVESAS